MINTELLAAYHQTVFKVYDPYLEIRIDEVNDELDKLLDSHNETTYAYITAWNPFSQLQSADENQHCNALLLNDLKEYTAFKGAGVGSDDSWEPEESFLVIGIAKDKAMSLAWKYRQNAIVFGSLGEKAELVPIEFSTAERLLAPLDITAPAFLSYPFSKGINLRITYSGNTYFEGWIDVARSSVEVFQNISRLEEASKLPGMLLVFDNPLTPAFVKMDVPFDFQSVWIEEDKNKELLVEKIGHHSAAEGNKGPFIQTVAGYRFLLLLPNKACKLPSFTSDLGRLKVTVGVLVWNFG